MHVWHAALSARQDGGRLPVETCNTGSGGWMDGWIYLWVLVEWDLVQWLSSNLNNLGDHFPVSSRVGLTWLWESFVKWIGRRKSEREENRFLKSFVQTGILGSPKIKYFRSPLFFFHHNKRYFLLQSFSLFSSTQNIFLLCLLHSSSPLFTLFTKYYPARITCLLFLLHCFSHLQKKIQIWNKIDSQTWLGHLVLFQYSKLDESRQ